MLERKRYEIHMMTISVASTVVEATEEEVKRIILLRNKIFDAIPEANWDNELGSYDYGTLEYDEI